MAAEDLKDAIAANAAGPKAASGDTGSVTQHSLPDQVAADKYLKGQQAAGLKSRGLRLSKMIPPGAV